MTVDLHLPPHWRQRVLRVLDAPETSENLRFLKAWALAEGGSARYNPLNTTYKLHNSWNYNTLNKATGLGVQNFKRPVEGVCATAITLVNGHYPMIVNCLRYRDITAEEIVAKCRAEIKVWGTNPDVILSVLKRL